MKKTLLSLAFLTAGAASYAQIGAGTMMFGGTIGFGSTSGKTETTGATNAALNVSFDAPATSTLSISPTFGYFLNENLAVGASLNFGSNSNTTKMVGNTSTGSTSVDDGSALGTNEVKWDKKVAGSGFGITLFANKYNTISDKWMFYMGGNLGFNMASGTTTSWKSNGATPAVYASKEEDAPSTTTISLGANIGVLYFLNENWGLQAGLNNLFAFNYVMGKQEVDNGTGNGKTTTTTSDMNLTLGTNSVGLGGVSIGLYYFLR